MNKFFVILFWIFFVFIASIPFWLTESDTEEQTSVAEIKSADGTAIPKNALGIPKFSEFRDVKRKKRAFINYLKPVIKKNNDVIRQQRQEVIAMRESMQESELGSGDVKRLQQLAEQYKEDPEQPPEQLIAALLQKVDVIPMELALMQAANESGWGTSRFARQGYNFYGLWCYREGCGFVPKKRDSGAAHEVAKFSSISHATSRYLNNLNSHYAYDELREIRASLREENKPLDAELIATGLLSYSERGEDYIEELVGMMRVNRQYIY